MRLFSFTIVVFIITVSSLQAQHMSDQAWYLGLAPGGALRWQDGTVRTCPEADCEPFVDGSGMGFSVGLRMMYPIGEDLFLRGGAGWEQAAGEFSETRRGYPILGQGYKVEFVDMQNDLETTISTLQIEAGVAYRLLDAGVYVSAGPVLTLPLSAHWKQTETISGPSGVIYTEGGETVVLLDEDVPDMSAFLGLRFGAGVMLPLTDGLVLAPELQYTLPLGDMQSDLAWSMSGMDLSVAFMLRM
jgi:hypothetical protein